MKLCTLVLLLSCLSSVSATHAQTFGRVEETQSNISSYYFHRMPGEATVQAYVWGTVRNPGLYEVSANTDLGKLLALAGGPLLSSTSTASRRDIVVELFRMESGARRRIYEAPLDSMVAEPGRYPVLQDGDLIRVQTFEHRLFGWRDVLAILGSAAAIVVAVDRVLR